ncbi:class I SAM-dependent methyltransferase [candidate division KSB1 bacterium]|nr:class I SAM-dependent methyltransferase [candidate division KSB1 bacterium]
MNSDYPDDPEQAADYDQLARKYQWFGPEILFGLCYEFIKPGDRLLDIGIGTGLCSSLFHKYGLEIYGIDNSNEMLAMCRQKGIAKELKKWDLHNSPLPYPDAQFDLIISGGVFHFFEDLSLIFAEAARLTSFDGLFAFIDCPTLEDVTVDSYIKYSQDNTPIFCHSDSYLRRLLSQNNFQIIKELKFFVLDEKEKYLLMKNFVVKRIN